MAGPLNDPSPFCGQRSGAYPGAFEVQVIEIQGAGRTRVGQIRSDSATGHGIRHSPVRRSSQSTMPAN